MQLIKAIDEASKNIVGNYIGTTVYFMIDSQIIKGVVTGYDRHQLFVNSQYAIAYDDHFFDSEDALISHLRESKKDLTTNA